MLNGPALFFFTLTRLSITMHLILLLLACGSSHQSSTQPKTTTTFEDRPTEHEAIPVNDYGVFFIEQNTLTLKKSNRVLVEEKFALEELYKGPTSKEKENGLVFLTCGTTGARLLSIKDGLATVQLEGECKGCGAVGVYDSIVASLKQFPTILYVHILDPQGKTQADSPTQDARPACLEP